MLLGLLVGLPLLGLFLWSDEWLRSQRSFLTGPAWSLLAQSISGAANGACLIPLMVVGTLWFDRNGRKKTARILSVMLLSGLVAGMAGTALRSLIGRTRPEVAVEQGWFGPRREGRWLVGKHAYASFPSGHASMAAGVGFMAFALGRRPGAAGMAFALAVAWARFHLGAHRASDVWAGLMLGGVTSVALWPASASWIREGRRPECWPRAWSLLVESATETECRSQSRRPAASPSG